MISANGVLVSPWTLAERLPTFCRGDCANPEELLMRVAWASVRAGTRISDLRGLGLCGQGRGNLGLHGLRCLFHQALVTVFGNLALIKAVFSTDSSDANITG